MHRLVEPAPERRIGYHADGDKGDEVTTHPVQQAWTPYCGAAPAPAELLGRWNLDPLLLAAIAGLALAWHWRVGRVAPERRSWFAAALGLLLLLFVSPFCALTSALFSARVVHHVLLTAVVAPLLVLSLPRPLLRVPGPLTLWTAAQAAVFWAWHAPGLYAWALSSDFIYWLMQLTLLGTAFGFWSVLRRTAEPAAVAALLATMVQMGLLGALITFSAAPLYAPHFGTTAVWGMAPLDDQQLGGLIMWAPAAAIYLAAALFLANRWLGGESRAATR